MTLEGRTRRQRQSRAWEACTKLIAQYGVRGTWLWRGLSSPPSTLLSCTAASQLHANQKSNGGLPPHESFVDQLHWQAYAERPSAWRRFTRTFDTLGMKLRKNM